MNIDFDLSLVQGKKVLCAVSGGADSMCLLHLLRSSGVAVTAAHFEHGIRGGESLRDLKFVESFCLGQGIPFVSERADVPAYAAANSMGIEEAARKLRYEFLERCLEEQGLELIATAHNADDNAETLVFNLSRGTGAMGLRGIPRRRGSIVRPLLGASRADIENYLSENAVPHVEDSSNESDDYTRNLIRHRVIPVLKEINPRFPEAAGRTAALCSRDEDCLSSMAEEFIRMHYSAESLPLGDFCALHPAIASRVLRKLVPGLGMEHVDSVLSFAAQPGLAELDLPGKTLRREQGRLYFAAPVQSPLSSRELHLGSELILPECSLAVTGEMCIYMGEVNDLFKTSYIKYEIIKPDLRITGRQPGDSLRPLGRGCSKTLKSLFMENKYPQHLRDACPILRDEHGILMVYGLAVDERTRPQPGEKALKISFKKI